MIDKNSPLWLYLSGEQKKLCELGYLLLEEAKQNSAQKFYDYSYVVFPFAKCYEGFLKQYFLDQQFIGKRQYESDHFRVGKVLSPNLQRRLGNRSVYKQLCDIQGKCDLADELWRVWRRGRNRVFHYFPKNIEALNLNDAEEIIGEIISVMEKAIGEVEK